MVSPGIPQEPMAPQRDFPVCIRNPDQPHKLPLVYSSMGTWGWGNNQPKYEFSPTVQFMNSIGWRGAEDQEMVMPSVLIKSRAF